MRIGEAELIAGTLSEPSKMPGYATSTSAFECKVGSQLRKVTGSVCEGCYATRANYQHPSVKIAHARRLAGLRHPRWVEAMVTLIQNRVSDTDPYFRWHDSGDLQGEWHLANICEVARQTPTVRHWLPTREKALVKRYLRAGGVIPGNLTVRVSGSHGGWASSHRRELARLVYRRLPSAGRWLRLPGPDPGQSMRRLSRVLESGDHKRRVSQALMRSFARTRWICAAKTAARSVSGPERGPFDAAARAGQPSTRPAIPARVPSAEPRSPGRDRAPCPLCAPEVCGAMRRWESAGRRLSTEGTRRSSTTRPRRPWKGSTSRERSWPSVPTAITRGAYRFRRATGGAARRFASGSSGTLSRRVSPPTSRQPNADTESAQPGRKLRP